MSKPLNSLSIQNSMIASQTVLKKRFLAHAASQAPPGDYLGSEGHLGHAGGVAVQVIESTLDI